MTMISKRGAVPWILSVALAWEGLILLRTAVAFASLISTGLPVFLLVLFSVFGIVFFAFAYLAWRQNKWAYLGGVLLSVVFVLLEGSRIQSLVSNPADPSFFDVFSFLTAASVAIAYGGFGLYTARRPSEAPKQISRSAIFALVALGFVLGGSLVGVLAAGTQTSVLASAAAGKDVVVPMGASDPANGQFYAPATYVVSVGKSVTWFNGDNTAHTVTSDNKAFDSGNMNSGATFQFTFTKAGNYTYVCTYHPFMKGTVVVK